MASFMTGAFPPSQTCVAEAQFANRSGAHSPIDSILRAYEDRSDLASMPDSMGSAIRVNSESSMLPRPLNGAFGGIEREAPMSINVEQLPQHQARQLLNHSSSRPYLSGRSLTRQSSVVSLKDSASLTSSRSHDYARLPASRYKSLPRSSRPDAAYWRHQHFAEDDVGSQRMQGPYPKISASRQRSQRPGLARSDSNLRSVGNAPIPMNTYRSDHHLQGNVLPSQRQYSDWSEDYRGWQERDWKGPRRLPTVPASARRARHPRPPGTHRHITPQSLLPARSVRLKKALQSDHVLVSDISRSGHGYGLSPGATPYSSRAVTPSPSVSSKQDQFWDYSDGYMNVVNVYTCESSPEKRQFQQNYRRSKAGRPSLVKTIDEPRHHVQSNNSSNTAPESQSQSVASPRPLANSHKVQEKMSAWDECRRHQSTESHASNLEDCPISSDHHQIPTNEVCSPGTAYSGIDFGVIAQRLARELSARTSNKPSKKEDRDASLLENSALAFLNRDVSVAFRQPIGKTLKSELKDYGTSDQSQVVAIAHSTDGNMLCVSDANLHTQSSAIKEEASRHRRGSDPDILHLHMAKKDEEGIKWAGKRKSKLHRGKGKMVETVVGCLTPNPVVSRDVEIQDQHYAIGLNSGPGKRKDCYSSEIHHGPNELNDSAFGANEVTDDSASERKNARGLCSHSQPPLSVEDEMIRPDSDTLPGHCWDAVEPQYEPPSMTALPPAPLTPSSFSWTPVVPKRTSSRRRPDLSDVTEESTLNSFGQRVSTPARYRYATNTVDDTAESQTNGWKQEILWGPSHLPQLHLPCSLTDSESETNTTRMERKLNAPFPAIEDAYHWEENPHSQDHLLEKTVENTKKRQAYAPESRKVSIRGTISNVSLRGKILRARKGPTTKKAVAGSSDGGSLSDNVHTALSSDRSLRRQQGMDTLASEEASNSQSAGNMPSLPRIQIIPPTPDLYTGSVAPISVESGSSCSSIKGTFRRFGSSTGSCSHVIRAVSRRLKLNASVHQTEQLPIDDVHEAVYKLAQHKRNYRLRFCHIRSATRAF